MNISVVDSLLKEFNCPVGISDHSPGRIIPIASVALGASVIEKHVTLSRSLTGPDHPFAMTIEELADMVNDIRRLEKSLGDGIKKPTKSELLKQNRIRRGLYDPETHDPAMSDESIWLRPCY